ncbi:MAG: glycosyltransferase family 4 protein [Caldilineales bacterium]
MRILTAGPTGVVAMQRVLNWHIEAGDDVWITDYRNSFRRPLPPRFHFMPLLPLPRGNGADMILHRLGLGALAERAKQTRLRRLAAEARPDVIHIHSMDVRGQALARAGLGPLLVSAWGALPSLLVAPDRLLRPAAQELLLACDRLLVDAPALVEPAQRRVKPGCQVEYMPFGTDTTAFQPGRSTRALEWRTFFAIPDDAFVLLSPRMWADFYNHQQILRAFVLAYERFNRPVYLALVGLGGRPDALPHMHVAWQGVQHTPAAAAVRWLPRILYQEMPTLYAMSDAVVNYPSRDAFAVTLVETAACELPLITSLLPAYRGTFVEDSARLVPADDETALAEAMVEVVNQPAQARQDVLRAARRIAVAEYDDARVKQRLRQIYSEMAATS